MEECALQLGKYLADRLVNDKIGAAVGRGGGFVDQHQLIPAVIVDQARSRIHGKRSAADDKDIRFANVIHAFVNGVAVQTFLVQHNIRLDRAAAAAFRNAGACGDIAHIIWLVAAHTVVAQHRTVQLKHLFGARLLVQAVDILRDDRAALAHALPFGEL